MEGRCLCNLSAGVRGMMGGVEAECLQAVYFWMFARCWVLFRLPSSPAANAYRGRTGLTPDFVSRCQLWQTACLLPVTLPTRGN